jgi:hypothetical protein
LVAGRVELLGRDALVEAFVVGCVAFVVIGVTEACRVAEACRVTGACRLTAGRL